MLLKIIFLPKIFKMLKIIQLEKRASSSNLSFFLTNPINCANIDDSGSFLNWNWDICIMGHLLYNNSYDNSYQLYGMEQIEKGVAWAFFEFRMHDGKLR